MFSLNDDCNAVRLQSAHDRLGYLAGELLLDLRAASEAFDNARQLADANDAPVRYIADMGLAVEREEVVFAHAVERNVAQDHHLVVGYFETDLEVVSGVHGKAAEDLLVHLGDAAGSVEQPLAGRVFAHRMEQFGDGGLDSLPIERAAVGVQPRFFGHCP